MSVVQFSKFNGISIELVVCNVQVDTSFTKVHLLTTAHYIFGHNLAVCGPIFKIWLFVSQVIAKYVMCSGQKMNFGKILAKLDIAHYKFN